jgi:hypothetical protein
MSAANPRLRVLRAKKPQYSGWFIANSSNQILTLNDNGHEVWKNIPKRGIPRNAFDYGSEDRAKSELIWMLHTGHWPLMTMRVVRKTWT